MESVKQIILKYAKPDEELNANLLREAVAPLYGVSKPVINSCLAQLSKSRQISRISRGVYTIAKEKITFAPQLSDKAKRLYKALSKDFPYAKCCVYQGDWITPLMHNIASNNMLYVEAERDAAETIFEHLKARGKQVFYKPDNILIYRYIDIHDERNVIVKPLLSESPLNSIDNVPTPSLEKLLVDMYKDDDFSYLQGSEYHRIIQNAREKYIINESRLLRYAARRNCREQFKKLLKESDYDID